MDDSPDVVVFGATGYTGRGPDPIARAGTGSLVVAEAYDLTGRLLAWAATRLANGDVHGAGALGPVQAFGLDGLEQGCRTAGLARIIP
jgi:hypothetical protein